MSQAYINDDGKRQITEALARHHRKPIDEFTPQMLSAWARDAERHHDDGLGCYFEIRTHESNTGAPVLVFISEQGFDVVEDAEEAQATERDTPATM